MEFCTKNTKRARERIEHEDDDENDYVEGCRVRSVSGNRLGEKKLLKDVAGA